jgi:hypothetical protein
MATEPILVPDDVEITPQESVPHTYVELKRPDGLWRSDDTVAQDHAAWILQGAIMDRSQERLGESDKGLIFYRKMLEDQMKVVADGGEPINVLRDSAQNVLIHNPQEGWGRLGHNSNIDEVARYGSKLKDDIAASLKNTTNQGALTA